MTIKKFKEGLQTLGFPVVNTGYENKLKDLPFIVFAFPATNDFYADNQHYLEIVNGWVELYTVKIDYKLQREMINVFRELNIGYEKENEDYIDSEKIALCRFNVEFILTEQ